MVLQNSSALSYVFLLVNTLHLDSRHHVKLVLQKPKTKLIRKKVKNPDLKLGCDHLAFCYLDIPFYQFSSINFYFHI